jgi:hypothetical protein
MTSVTGEQPPVDPSSPDLVDVVSVKSADPATVREVFRARHRLAVSVMERPHQYTVVYTLADIHRLTFLSHDERSAIRNDWHAWHRKYSRLGPRGVCLWLAGAFAAGALWFKAATMTDAIQRAAGLTVPDIWFLGLAASITLALLAALPALLATLSAFALSDSYVRGYTDGLTRGVHSALHITPEIEREMWEELRSAERFDAGWRRATETSAQN